MTNQHGLITTILKLGSCKHSGKHKGHKKYRDHFNKQPDWYTYIKFQQQSSTPSPKMLWKWSLDRLRSLKAASKKDKQTAYEKSTNIKQEARTLIF